MLIILEVIISILNLFQITDIYDQSQLLLTDFTQIFYNSSNLTLLNANTLNSQFI